MIVTVVDSAAPDAAPHEVSADPETTLSELRGLVCSLPLPSVERVFEDSSHLAVCHDGALLGPEQDESTLLALGVEAAPVVVVLPMKTRAPSKDAQPKQQPTPVAAAPPERRAVRATDQDDTSDRAASEPAEATSRPAAPQEPPPDAVCRICFGQAYENGAGRLMSPCRCIGTMKYVHVSCLNEWRTASANPRSLYQCDQCHYEYNMQRTVYAEWLEDKRLHRAAAVLMLAMATLLSAATLGPLGAAGHLYAIMDCSPADLVHTNRLGRMLASMWSWQLDWLVVGLLGPGLAGLGVSLREAYQANRNIQFGYSWMVGLASMFAGNGLRPLRLLVVGGLCYSVKVALTAVEGVAKAQLTKWGTMILEVS